MNDVEYERMYRAEGLHWWYVSLHELILRHVRLEVEKRGRLAILDAGCGTGRLFWYNIAQCQEEIGKLDEALAAYGESGIIPERITRGGVEYAD